jgi:hypothetical protein
MRWDVGSPRSVHNAWMEEKMFEVFLKTAYTQYQIAGRLSRLDSISDTSMRLHHFQSMQELSPQDASARWIL